VVEGDAKKMAAKADAVVVAVGFDPETESEGADRTFSLPLGQDELIREIAAVNKNTVIIVTSGGGVDMNAWIDQVPAVLQAWYPGQEGGTALTEILFGDVNPSGRLPVSFEQRASDNPAYDNYYPSSKGTRVAYKEGIFLGYRGYERNGKQPQFAFGDGLSYTTFTYDNLSIVEPGANPVQNPGHNFAVSFDVTNTGKRDGIEVAQLYISDKHSKLPCPPKELKGFSRVSLRAGEKKRVTVSLDERSLSHYDPVLKRWHAEPGNFEVLIGHSVENIRLTGALSLKPPEIEQGRSGH
jgi:beta-glucosidase